ncbi:MAG: 4'-phosphopantetheinyl transferase superfamily protein [Pseudomonadales bacterium]|nr:4'-phosphopantetheinyl transferase superfamily protein [Pseudomonadales bacterium]
MTESTLVVWLTDQSATRHFDAATLGEADRARYQRMRSPLRRRQWQMSRALAAHVGARSAHSLSHSGEFACLAIDARAASVGVDLEVVTVRDFQRVARAAFAPPEIEQLDAAPRHAVAVQFYQLWTLKEAFAKALKLPLATALHDCSFELRDGNWRASIPTAANWRAVVWQPCPALVLSAVSITAPGSTSASDSCATYRWPSTDCRVWPMLLDLSSKAG